MVWSSAQPPTHPPPPHRIMTPRSAGSSHSLPSVIALSLLSLGFVIYKVDDFATQTKTLAGHNLDPTPWHFFPPKTFTDETLHDRAYKLIHCSYLSCRYKSNEVTERRRPPSSRAKAPKCPEFFRWIHHDLEPWARTRISAAHLETAKQYAAFRVVIVDGRLYVDLYWACVQSRAMFTIWGFLQLLASYPGRVPDVWISCLIVWISPSSTGPSTNRCLCRFSGTVRTVITLISHFLIGPSGVGKNHHSLIVF